MNIETINKSLYALLGSIFIIVGIITTLFSLGLLPSGLKEAILHIAKGELNSVHLVQEIGCLMVGTGLLSFWFIRNYNHSKSFHWAVTILFALIAIVHWFDVRGFKSTTGPIINSIPFALFAITGLLRKD
jgi:hypothetical protein